MVKANDRLPYRILVVDDEKAIRMMLVDFLENRYELDTADTGENALEMLKQKSMIWSSLILICQE